MSVVIINNITVNHIHVRDFIEEADDFVFRSEEMPGFIAREVVIVDKEENLYFGLALFKDEVDDTVPYEALYAKNIVAVGLNAENGEYITSWCAAQHEINDFFKECLEHKEEIESFDPNLLENDDEERDV